MIPIAIKDTIKNQSVVMLKGRFGKCANRAWCLEDVYVNGVRFRDHVWIHNYLIDIRRYAIMPGDRVKMRVRLKLYTKEECIIQVGVHQVLDSNLTPIAK
jgi:hypothetical protein